MLIMCGTALDFYCFCGFCALFESTYAFSVRIMPHTIGPERTVLRGAEPHFAWLVSYAVEALSSDRFER